VFLKDLIYFLEQLLVMNTSQTSDTVEYGLNRSSAGASPSPEQTDSFRPKFTIFANHRSIRSVWNEWKGLGVFHPSNDVYRYPGGLEALEEKYKATWRSSFTSAEHKRFSRISFIISRVKSQIKSGQSIEQALKYFEDIMPHNFSITAMEKLLKHGSDVASSSKTATSSNQ
jgi:hypothetical protein